uniref:Uncharacterized protein n=1 Tax=Arundo donax TaxID=35708 RepID=A0A0A9B3R7_ARUDO
MHQVSEFHSVQPLVAQLLSTQSIQARQQHPEFVGHLVQALHEGFARLFVHAEHSRNKLPSTREQWL